MEKHIRLTDSEVINENMLADLIHVFAHWENTYSERDFEEAFKGSPVNSKDLWQQFNACEKIPYIFYQSLEHKQQIMLLRYIFEHKHQEEIQNYQLNRAIFRLYDKEGE
jgi:ribonuclease HI